MAEFTAEYFDEFCRAGPVQTQIDGIEGVRKAAVAKFWMWMGGALVASLVLALLAGAMLNGVAAIIIFIIALVIGFAIAYQPLHKAGQSMKLPVLEALAERAGMTYRADQFEPPVFADAQRTIFGGWLSYAGFTDLFYGQDSEGSNFAFYEALLKRRVGKNTQIVFQGQCYALQRRPGGRGVTVILPDKGIFNFFKPGAGMERVHFEGHDEFEKRFEVYSTELMEAKAMLASQVLRDQLLAARGTSWGSRLFAFITPSDAFVAISGTDRFEPGSMFRSTPGRERVRSMYGEVCHSLGVLKQLKAGLG